MPKLGLDQDDGQMYLNFHQNPVDIVYSIQYTAII